MKKRPEDDLGSVLFYEVPVRCDEVSEPYTHNRAELFKRIEDLLSKFCRHTGLAAVSKALPLVIVDEAHNWKNGHVLRDKPWKRGFATRLLKRERNAKRALNHLKTLRVTGAERVG